MNPIKQEIISHYMDLCGAVTINKDVSKPSQQNGLMQTGFFIACLSYLGFIEEIDKNGFKDTIAQHEVEKGFKSIAGIYERYPGCPDSSDFDDAHNVVGAAICVDLPFNRDVLLYGLLH